jgi:hypothetical protein
METVRGWAHESGNLPSAPIFLGRDYNPKRILLVDGKDLFHLYLPGFGPRLIYARRETLDHPKIGELQRI